MKLSKRVLSLLICLLMLASATFVASASSADLYLGDANEDDSVNVKDATLIQKYAASLLQLSDEQFSAADVNDDRKVNVKDATAIQKYSAGIETGFPIGLPQNTEKDPPADTSITVCLGSYPESIDPALNSAIDGSTYIVHAFSGLVGYEKSESGALKLIPECAQELPKAVELEDGKVAYKFKLRDGLKWSDGSPLTAHDFVYAWNRAVSPELWADYGYMFDVIDGYEDAAYGEGKLNVEASDDGKYFTVVLKSDVPYFLELCAFTTYMPVKQEVVEGNEDWTASAKTYIGNGPYKVTKIADDQFVMEKNEYYHNSAAVKTNKIIWPFSENDDYNYEKFCNGDYHFIDSIPYNRMDEVNKQYSDLYKVIGQLGTYYVSFNVNAEELSMFTQKEQESIRKALSLLIDRSYIASEMGYGAKPANTFVPMGVIDADGVTEFMNNANGGEGYFSIYANDYQVNCREAVTLLKEVARSSGEFTVNADGSVSGFPTITYITNEGVGHEYIAEYMQSVYAQYGIDMRIRVMEWNTFLDTRWSGNYTFARNGWLADYNDPISFLDMWMTYAGNNDCQFGWDSHADYAGYSYNGKDGLTWGESYDMLISEIKSSKDTEKRYELMHKAEDMLMQTGAICPLYYYTDDFLHSKDLENFFANPLGFKYFMYAYCS